MKHVVQVLRIVTINRYYVKVRGSTGAMYSTRGSLHPGIGSNMPFRLRLTSTEMITTNTIGKTSTEMINEYRDDND